MTTEECVELIFKRVLRSASVGKKDALPVITRYVDVPLIIQAANSRNPCRATVTSNKRSVCFATVKRNDFCRSADPMGNGITITALCTEQAALKIIRSTLSIPLGNIVTNKQVILLSLGL